MFYAVPSRINRHAAKPPEHALPISNTVPCLWGFHQK